MTPQQPDVSEKDLVTLALRAVDEARRAGADEAEAYLEFGKTFEVTIRGGEIEILKQARPRGLGLRVVCDQRLGFSHTNDVGEPTLCSLARQTVAIAKHAAKDEFLGLPDNKQIDPTSTVGRLDLVDYALIELTTDRKIALAREMEQASLSVDPRVKLVEGATVADSDECVVIANSTGLAGSYRATASMLSCSVVAEADGMKQVNYWYSNKRHFDEHETVAEVGRKAAERALQMLNARKIASGKFPVVFDPLSASSLISTLAGALSGESVYRNMSFLTDKRHERVGPEQFTLVDDGLLPRGNASRPFDAEGVASKTTPVVDRGILKSFLYDSYTARKVNGISTANASRTYATTPHISPSNLYVVRGEHDPQAIIRSIHDGFYVTGMIGFGVDLVSGQFSRGASGVWISRGELAFPVQEVTIAGTLLEMLSNIEMIGNDLSFLGAISSPTLKMSEMTISGE
ncbi:MAG: TldD/PmbA family protein [Ignavibacteria bacterium]|nr:TldD/PmbA family protein [Ignavibacteria bacterium]